MSSNARALSPITYKGDYLGRITETKINKFFLVSAYLCEKIDNIIPEDVTSYEGLLLHEVRIH